jgi:hypothetical protein
MHTLSLITTTITSVTFSCSCNEYFEHKEWEQAFSLYRAHRDTVDTIERRRQTLREGFGVIVTDEKHPLFDQIGVCTILGDTTAFVRFETNRLGPISDEIIQRDALAVWHPPVGG